MDERRGDDEVPEVIEGADSAALGTAAPPESAPPGARVEGAEHRVPGPTYDGPGTAAKPWNTSLAADDDQAGVANEEPREPDTLDHAEDDEPA